MTFLMRAYYKENFNLLHKTLQTSSFCINYVWGFRDLRYEALNNAMTFHVMRLCDWCTRCGNTLLSDVYCNLFYYIFLHKFCQGQNDHKKRHYNLY